MIRLSILGIAGLITALLLPSPTWTVSTPLLDVLATLGDSTALHRRAEISEYGDPGADTLRAAQGNRLIHQGFVVLRDGDTSQPISRFFVCTDCHNTVAEDPDLRFSDPEARLSFAVKHDIPFLQGTTLKGVINRETWYNGDYAVKYGGRALEAHKDLRKAIQLCAEECSQGRPLEDWELQAILAYLQSIAYTLGDFNLSQATWNRLLQAQESDDPELRAALLIELKSYYFRASPATFLDIPEDPAAGYGQAGEPERGAALYQHSCMHCHKPGGVARFELDNDTLSFKRLNAKISRTRGSGFYPAIRHGLSASERRPKYMPLYPAQRMSNGQIEDLRAYIEQNSR